MAKVGATEAARLAGIDRATLYRHVKAGKVSATVGKGGRKSFDTAELERAFGPLQQTAPRSTPRSARRSATVGDPVQYVAELQREIARLERELDRVRAELHEERAERRHLQGLLNQRTLPGPGLLDTVARLFGR